MTDGGGADVDAERVCNLVRALGIPVPWDLRNLLKSIAATRGKPIRLVTYGGLGAYSRSCGIWIGRLEDDIIVYDGTTSAYHAEQIILHELGHMLLNHCQPGSIQGPAHIPDLVPDIHPNTVQHVLGRNAFDSEQERQAELFASLMMSQRRRLTPESKLLDTFLVQ